MPRRVTSSAPHAVVKTPAPAKAAAMVLRAAGSLDKAALDLLRVETPAGKFVAEKMIGQPDSFEIEALHQRAKAAFVAGAPLCVPALFDELSRDEPNKTRVDGYLAVIKAAGIAVDRMPVSQKDAEKARAASLAQADVSNEVLKQRIADRMREMRAAAESDKPER